MCGKNANETLENDMLSSVNLMHIKHHWHCNFNSKWTHSKGPKKAAC